MGYRIYRRNEAVQILGSSCRSNAAVYARLVNTPQGWLALRGEEGRDTAPVNVSRLINQADGADQIAAALGLPTQ